MASRNTENNARGSVMDENTSLNKCKECPIGKLKIQELLETSDSVFDAVYDFRDFITTCSNTCCKEEIVNE